MFGVLKNCPIEMTSQHLHLRLPHREIIGTDLVEENLAFVSNFFKLGACLLQLMSLVLDRMFATFLLLFNIVNPCFIVL
jgi:hypothetical protein